MRSKKRNTNIKILQSQLQNLEVNNVKPVETIKLDVLGKGVTETPINKKIPKKRGIPKNELINTKRLLT